MVADRIAAICETSSPDLLIDAMQSRLGVTLRSGRVLFDSRWFKVCMLPVLPNTVRLAAPIDTSIVERVDGPLIVSVVFSNGVQYEWFRGGFAREELTSGDES